jgi:hypothetical protein
MILLIIGFGANADGKWFRLYSYATILILILAGASSFMYLSEISANLPTPWLGVRERINIYGYMIWWIVLAIVLLRSPAPVVTSKPSTGIGTPRLTSR